MSKDDHPPASAVSPDAEGSKDRGTEPRQSKLDTVRQNVSYGLAAASFTCALTLLAKSEPLSEGQEAALWWLSFCIPLAITAGSLRALLTPVVSHYLALESPYRSHLRVLFAIAGVLLIGVGSLADIGCFIGIYHLFDATSPQAAKNLLYGSLVSLGVVLVFCAVVVHTPAILLSVLAFWKRARGPSEPSEGDKPRQIEEVSRAITDVGSQWGHGEAPAAGTRDALCFAR
jgi:hypothetical protein